MIDVTEILVHWHAGRSLNEMSQSLGVDRKTIRKYIAPAVAAGIVPGGPAKGEGEWQGLVRGWFPELADTRLRQVTWPAIAEHHEYIAEQVKAGVRMSPREVASTPVRAAPSVAEMANGKALTRSP